MLVPGVTCRTTIEASRRCAARLVPIEHLVPEVDVGLVDTGHSFGAEHQGAVEVRPDCADIRMHAKNVRRRPPKADCLIGPTVQEVDARLVRAPPGLLLT